MEEVIENELKCVQRNCCRLENECAKCDLVLPIEEIINAYNEALRIKKENIKLKSRDCWKSCEYASPKAELIEQHIKDVQNITRAKEIIKELLDTQNRLDPYRDLFKDRILKAEQFLKECEE